MSLGLNTQSVEAAYAVKKKRKGHTAPIPAKSVRADGQGHWPEFGQNRGRCRYPGCHGIPKVKCSKCHAYLCFTPTSNCFKNFHKEEFIILILKDDVHIFCLPF